MINVMLNEKSIEALKVVVSNKAKPMILKF